MHLENEYLLNSYNLHRTLPPLFLSDDNNNTNGVILECLVQ